MKMFKKALAALLTLCMVFSLAACGGSSKEAPAETKDPASTEAPATEEKSYHIGLALDTYSNAICAEIASIFEEECTARGYEFTVTDGEGDASKQLSDISTLIQKKVDAIVVLPVSSNSVDEGIIAANEAGIPIATVLRNTPNVADKLVCFSGTNGVSTAENRTIGFHNIVDTYEGLNIVAEQDGNYNRSDAMTVMEAILQANPEIDAVWCANDEMAGGVCQAISAAGREGILVCGANFQSDAYDRLMSGEQAADITTPCAMVIPAIDALVTVLEGGTVAEKILYYPLDLITKENAEQFKDQLY